VASLPCAAARSATRRARAEGSGRVVFTTTGRSRLRRISVWQLRCSTRWWPTRTVTPENCLWDETDQQLYLVDHGFSSFAREGDILGSTVFVTWRRDAQASQLSSVEVNLLGDAGQRGMRRDIGALLEPERAACSARAKRPALLELAWHCQAGSR
jgi:hypothetical protein